MNLKIEIELREDNQINEVLIMLGKIGEALDIYNVLKLGQKGLVKRNKSAQTVANWEVVS